MTNKNRKSLINQLSADHYEMLIVNGMAFMQTVTTVFGAERGMELWEKIAEVVDPGLKQEIFIRMLVGDIDNRITFRAGINSDMIPVIKAIRTATGLGLKETKDLWDMSKVKFVSVEVPNVGRRHQLRQELEFLNMEVL